MRIIVERDLINAIDADIFIDEALLVERRTILDQYEEAWQDSMSPLLDPTGPIGFGLRPGRSVSYREFAEAMQRLFYERRGGPEIFYYGDCFLC